jgi:hypothetical protein
VAKHGGRAGRRARAAFVRPGPRLSPLRRDPRRGHDALGKAVAGVDPLGQVAVHGAGAAVVGEEREAEVVVVAVEEEAEVAEAEA